MILLIDNYDSFTYNLYQYLGELGAQVEVVRNDQVTLEDIEELAPERMIISPGPGNPDDAGISKDVIRLVLWYVTVQDIREARRQFHDHLLHMFRAAPKQTIQDCRARGRQR